MPKPTRIMIEIADHVRARMESIQSLVGAEDLVDVIRKALAIYDLLISETEKGARVILRTGPVDSEVIIKECRVLH